MYKSFIKNVLIETKAISLSTFGKASGSVKPEDNNQVLTETDTRIGQKIIEKINEFFPEHNIIDEEAGVIDKNSEFSWVIDPIDGTSNFACGVPLYGTMVGLLRRNLPIAGGISLPNYNEIYLAEKEKGAYCNSEKIHVTPEKNLISVLIAYTLDGHRTNPESTRKEGKIMAEIVLNIRNLRNSGSCFDLAMVAKGKFGGYLNQTSKIWDNVAQDIIITEAGGVYTDFYGQPINYQNPTAKADQNFTLCAASPVLHKKLQSIIHASL